MADPGDIPGRIYLIGAGAAGSAVARALTSAGIGFAGVVSRTAESATQIATELGIPGSGERLEGIELPALVIVAVPDDAIVEVASELAAAHDDWSNSIVSHLSGARPSSALMTLKHKGAATVSFHPMVSLRADSPPTVFRGARVNIEGDARGIAVCARLATLIGAEPSEVNADTKLGIHVAASIASNYVVTLASVATELLAREGLTPSEFEALLGPLFNSTVENISFDAPIDALTGPVIRGDVETVRHHLEFLASRHPEFLPLVANLVAETARAVVQQGRIPLEAGEAMLRVVHEIIESSPS